MYGYRTVTPKERVDWKYSITVSGGPSVWTAGIRTIPMLFAACCITSIFFLNYHFPLLFFPPSSIDIVIRVPLLGRHTGISLSVRPSVYLSVCMYEVKCSKHICLSVAQSGLNFTYRVPLGKRLQWPKTKFLNQGFKSEQNSKKNLCKDHIFFPLGIILLVLYAQCAFGQGVCINIELSLLVKVLSHISDQVKNLCPKHIFFHLSSLLVILYISRAFLVRGMHTVQ